MQKDEVEGFPTSNTKINLKWIKDLHMRPKTIKVIKENIGGNLQDLGFGNDFLDITSKAQATKAKIDKWDDIKFKNSVY